MGDLVLRKAKVSDPTRSRGQLAPNWEDVDLAATSPCPWTVSPLTWPTRRVGVGLTQAWKGQPLYDRPDKGKVGKIDIPNCKKDGACLAARTMDGMVRYDGMVSNKEDKGLKYEHPQSLL
ncbi:hypothetical protein GW17_00029422 [Ensete ventricosum]|nr:hypothetical protein GW17_00029422 [Ensete ventricosum]